MRAARSVSSRRPAASPPAGNGGVYCHISPQRPTRPHANQHPQASSWTLDRESSAATSSSNAQYSAGVTSNYFRSRRHHRCGSSTSSAPPNREFLNIFIGAAFAISRSLFRWAFPSCGSFVQIKMDTSERVAGDSPTPPYWPQLPHTTTGPFIPTSPSPVAIFESGPMPWRFPCPQSLPADHALVQPACQWEQRITSAPDGHRNTNM